MTHRISILGSLVLLAAAALGALPVASAEDQSVTLLTGPKRGTYHALGALLEGRSVPGLKLEAASSEGSIGNLIMTSLGKADFGMAQADALSFMREQPEYGPAMGKIRVVLPLHREELHVLVRQGSGIAKLADLKGKRFNLGVGASGSSISGLVLLTVLGLDEKSVAVSQLENDEALAALRSGKLDAMLVVGGAPLGFLHALPASDAAAFGLLAIDPETAGLLTAEMPYWAATVPAGTYPWQPKEVATVATQCLLVTHAGEAADRVYPLAAAILAQAADLAKGHPKWGEVTGARAKADLARKGVPYHPGAEKAIRELK